MDQQRFYMTFKAVDEQVYNQFVDVVEDDALSMSTVSIDA